jgi:protein SCO1/2
MVRPLRLLLYAALLVCAVISGAIVLAVGGFYGPAQRVLGPVAAALGLPHPAMEDAASASGVSVGGPFQLTDMNGQAVSEASYRGRWMLIFFGYSFCPDVCPTELQTIATALDRLGPLAAKVQPLFITIDPARDTPVALKTYVALFGNRIVGLSGSPEQIAAVARAYRVYYAKVTPSGGGPYLMDHSAFIYLMNEKGRFVTLFGPDTSAQKLAEGLKARLSAGS